MFIKYVKTLLSSITRKNKRGSHVKTIYDFYKLWKSGHFDVAYYLLNNPDVKESKINPLLHYLKIGGFEGRDPSKHFSSLLYFRRFPHIESLKINPLLHHLNMGGVMPFPMPQKEQPVEALPPDLIMEIATIKESEDFNHDYYLLNNPSLINSGIDPIKHFCTTGWKNGKNPSQEFDINFYNSQYKDVADSGMNPLFHYITSGKMENRLPKNYSFNEEECLAQADVTETTNLLDEYDSIKIAVVCHLYYIDLINEIKSYLNSIHIPYDLYISTSEQHESVVRREFYPSDNLREVNVHVSSNSGRDINPFITFYKEFLFQYDFVCKIHTKKSHHDINLILWRRYLLDNLLGTPDIVKKHISELKCDKNLGLICPVAHPYLSHLKIDQNWGDNYRIASDYFPEFDCTKYYEEEFTFPSGSMFWFKPSALYFLKNKSFPLSDFNSKNNKSDGTLAHAIERMFGIIPIEAGYSIKTAFFSKPIKQPTAIMPKVNIEGSKRILFVAHDLFLAGAENILLQIIKWFKLHTSHEIACISLTRGIDGGQLYSEFNKYSEIYILDEMTEAINEFEKINSIRKVIGEIDLIYGNTITSPIIYKQLQIFKAPIITHIHELGQSIKKYTSSEIISDMKKYTTNYIACSTPVRNYLQEEQNIDTNKIYLVNEFIETNTPLNIENTRLRRNENGIENNKLIVWGCGTIYWRKSVDIFIQTARQLKLNGFNDFHFYWIGRNFWHLDSDEYGTWEDWESYIVEHDLTSHISFLGEHKNPAQFYAKGDIFYLPSREDPFPLACLEAAHSNLPIVCFEDAGGMPSFVENDAGTIVPFLNIEVAAKEIELLFKNPNILTKKGEQAREKLLKFHSNQMSLPLINNICNITMGNQPLVSVIVPIYNHEKFIEKRIESILKQTFKDCEIIILDDCSTDNSYSIIEKYHSHPSITIIRNEINSACVSRQWQKGVLLAKGKYIWIAEGDDFSDSKFIETLLPAFNKKEVNIAYCASHTIDQNENITPEFYLNIGHYDKLNFPKRRWLQNYTASGTDEIENALSIRNSIPNASAVIMRTDAIKKVDFDLASSFRCTGDWFVYISILKQGEIHYVSEHLNYHRIHEDSVISKNKKNIQDIIPDYFQMHKYILQNHPLTKPVFDLMKNSVVRDLKNIWENCSEQEFSQYYNTLHLDMIFNKKK